jgi:HK97 family phage major capsid protein
MEKSEKDGNQEQINAAIKAGKEAFDKRADAILALGEEVGDSNWALSQLRSDKSVEAVQREAISKIKEDTKSLGSLSQPEPLGLNEKESKSYSITNAMKSLVNEGKVNGLEKEVSDAIAKRSGKETHGFFLASQRDLVAGTATDGAELVPTDTRGGDFIDALRPNMVTMQAGVRVLNGLKGDVSIPRKTSTSTATFKAEVTTHVSSEPQFDSVTLTPRHLGCFTDVSKQLLAQGSPDVDALIRDDLNKAIAVGLDKAVIQGAGDGSNAPQGIIGATDVPVITIADNDGGEPTKAELHEFLKSLDDNNALSGNCTWITTPTIAAAAKQTLLDSGVSGYQWNMDNNTMLGYPAFSTANIPAERTIFGDFSEYILGVFDGIEIVYDPYSGAKTRTVTFVLNLMCDGDVRQPLAFATSDSGAP